MTLIRRAGRIVSFVAACGACCFLCSVGLAQNAPQNASGKDSAPPSFSRWLEHGMSSSACG
jgi:hypothetical protein